MMSNTATWGLIGALWLAEIAASFGTAMIYAAQRALTDDLGDPVKVGWLITSYLLIGAGAAALAGRLGDIFGRRRVMLVMLAIAFAGSLTSALSTSFTLVLAGRCLQGLAGAILPLSVGLLRENVERNKLALAIGLMISGASAGTAAGLVVGGVIVDHYFWHGVFLMSAALSGTTFATVLALVPKSPQLITKAPLDWIGGILFVPAVFSLLLAITSGPKWGITDWRTPTSLGVGISLLGLWIINSLRTEAPLFDVRLFARREVFVVNAVTALVSMSTLQITLVFSLLLQAPSWTGIGLGATATMAGLAKLPSNVFALVAAPLSGWLTSRGGGRMTMIVGGIITTTGWGLALFYHDSLLVLTLILIVIAFGATIQFAVGPTILAAAVPVDRTSEAAGMMTVVRQGFLGIGAQMVSVLLATSTIKAVGGGASYPTVTAFNLTMAVVIGLCIVATLLSILLPKGAKQAEEVLADQQGTAA